MTIKLLKLLNGEEIITKYNGLNTGGAHMIEDPVRIIVVPTSDPNNPRIALAKWAQFSSDTKFTLETFHVVAIMEPVMEFITEYQKTFSAVALPPQSKLIIPRK